MSINIYGKVYGDRHTCMYNPRSLRGTSMYEYKRTNSDFYQMTMQTRMGNYFLFHDDKPHLWTIMLLQIESSGPSVVSKRIR
jgi:hypothetical protein